MAGTAALGWGGAGCSRARTRQLVRSGATSSRSTNAELGLLLPHAALLVHHGGIGTVARAIEAGIPQIVSPLTYDQPDNARRVERLGLGALLERANLNGDSLAAQAEQLLGDGGSRQRLAAANERVLAQNGIVECADLLERVATSAFAVSAGRRAGGMR